MDASLKNSILLKDLKIYQWLFSFFGLNFPPFLIYRREKDLKYYLSLLAFFLHSFILLAIVTRAGYIHIVIVCEAKQRHRFDSMTEIISHIQNTSQVLLQLLMEYKCWLSHRNLLDILTLIQKLEHNMLSICPNIFHNQKLSKRLMFNTALFFIILTLLLFYVNWFLIAEDMQKTDKIFVLFFLICMQMKFLEYGIYVQLINEYLVMLMESLKCLRTKIEYESKRTQLLNWFYQKTLRRNQSSLIEVWCLVHKLEEYFAWPIFLLFFYNGIVILATVSWAYVHYIYETRQVFQTLRLTNISMVLLNMLLLCYLTQKCINQYQNISHLLLNFKLYPHDKEMIMGIKEYSLQLLHQPIKFTCNGYINIDLSYFGMTSLVIFTYTIIVIQFKMTDVSEGAVRATRVIFGRF